MADFDAIFFDFDGVLLDSEPVHWACWSQVLAPLGVNLTWEFYRDYCIGIDDREMLRMMASQSDPPKDWTILWAQYPAKQVLFSARMEKDPPFDEALPALFAEIDGHYKLAVVSSSACYEIEPLLESAGLRRHFATVIGGDSVKLHKPAPEPYLLAAERLKAAKPLVLEDSPAGIASGRSAGFEVLTVPHPKDVPGLLRRRLAE